MFFQRPKNYIKENKIKDCSSFRVGLGAETVAGYIYIRS
jgi:hypothetical protein